MELMVTTLRNTLERPSGGYFSPGLEQRLEPKRLVLASVFQAASSLFWANFWQGLLLS